MVSLRVILRTFSLPKQHTVLDTLSIIPIHISRFRAPPVIKAEVVSLQQDVCY